jgi:hypothetical protein
MTHISSWIPIIGGAWVVFLAILFAILRPRAHSDRAASKRNQRTAAQFGLPLTPESEPIIEAGIRRTFHAAMYGAFGALLVAAVVLMVIGENTPGHIFFGYTLTMYAGFGVSATVAALVAERRRQASSIRFARSRAVTISDYRSLLEQWTPRIVVALLTVGLALRSLLSLRGIGDIPPFIPIFALVAVIAAGIFEVANRLVVGKGQPAGSAIELAWDDAFTGRALASIGLSVTNLAAYGSLFSIVFLAGREEQGAIAGEKVQILFSIVAVILVVVAAIIGAATKAQQRYLRRLWPQFSAENDARAASAAAASWARTVRS